MFISNDIETLLSYLNKLEPGTKPKWGIMSAQRMVEHLTDTVRMATGKNPQEQLVSDDKLPRQHAFIESDMPLPRGYQAVFALPDTPLRNEELELAIDEFIEEMIWFEELYQQEPDRTEIHPNFGPLNYAQWTRMSSKHSTHHFIQFGLIEE